MSNEQTEFKRHTARAPITKPVIPFIRETTTVLFGLCALIIFFGVIFGVLWVTMAGCGGAVVALAVKLDLEWAINEGKVLDK